MSNKPKFSNKVKLQQIKRPTRITFRQYLADLAGCGNIRVAFPSLLLNTYHNPEEQISFESFYGNQYDPDPRGYANSTFVVFQRSATKEQAGVIQHFRKINPNKPCIYEIDDNLFDIPEWNFASGFYKELKPHIKNIMGMCTGITASTPYLKKRLLKYNKNIQVIPNHLPKFIWGDTTFNDFSHEKVRICYPGSFNHFDQNGDKGDFSTELIDFIQKTLDIYQWVFVGGMPAQLKDNPKIEYHGWQGVLEYPHFIKTLNIDIMLAPLEVNVFNKCKSNIKALEATAIGVPLVCSDIEPYKGLPLATNDPDQFISLIEKLAEYKDFRYDTYKQQYGILEKQLYWEDHDNILHYVDSFLRLIGKRL